MLKKFDLFEKLNVALGVASLSAIFVGALTTFGGLGLRHLSKGGVEIMPEERAERIANLGISSVTFGLLGYSSAIAIAVGSAIIPEVMKSAASHQYQISKRKHLSQVPHTPDKLTVLKPIAFEVEESPIKSQANDKIYLYQVMNISSKSDCEGKLVVGRVEQQPNQKAIIYSELDDSQINFLCELFDEYDRNELVVKAFSSLQPNADNAVAEYIDIHRHYISVLNKDNFSRCELEKCVGCINLYGDHKIVCGIHPYGWNESSYCPDKKVDSRLVYQEYEREEVIEQLNQQIKTSRAFIQKYDDGTLMIWDDHTNRRFKFDWSGFLIGDDKINGLASLLSYVSYFASRQIVEQDFSDYIDKFNEDLKGIATVQLSDVGISVKVIANESINSYLTRVYCFRLDGIPLYPYESIVFEEIKHSYNLLTLVGYLKVKSIHQFSKKS
jgi:hypothetical protein